MYVCFRCRKKLKRNPKLEIKVNGYSRSPCVRLYCRKCCRVIRNRLSGYAYPSVIDFPDRTWPIIELDDIAYDATIIPDKHKPECRNYYLWAGRRTI